MKNVILTGSTGMIGGMALDLCLSHPEVGTVTTLARRPLAIEHKKLTQIIHKDFTDYSTLGSVFENQDAALFCLGAYTGAVPDDVFKTITVDYTMAFATALKAASPNASFCLLSGQGADQTEQSRVSFAKYKGTAENGLMTLDFPRLHIFRPGYIYPVTPRQEPNIMYRVSRALYPIIKHIYPNIGIESDALARTMVDVALHGRSDNASPVMENRDIREFAKQHIS